MRAGKRRQWSAADMEAANREYRRLKGIDDPTTDG